MEVEPIRILNGSSQMRALVQNGFRGILPIKAKRPLSMKTVRLCRVMVSINRVWDNKVIRDNLPSSLHHLFNPEEASDNSLAGIQGAVSSLGIQGVAVNQGMQCNEVAECPAECPVGCPVGCLAG